MATPTRNTPVQTGHDQLPFQVLIGTITGLCVVTAVGSLFVILGWDYLPPLSDLTGTRRLQELRLVAAADLYLGVVALLSAAVVARVEHRISTARTQGEPGSYWSAVFATAAAACGTCLGVGITILATIGP